MLLAGHVGVLVPCVILVLLCAVCVVIIGRQPESKEAITFKVTIKPWISVFELLCCVSAFPFFIMEKTHQWLRS